MDSSKQPVSLPVNIASFAFVGAFVLATVWFKMLPAAFAGLLVYAITRSVTKMLLGRVSPKLSRHAKAVALGGVVVAVLALFVGLALLTFHFVHSKDGLRWLLSSAADLLDRLRAGLPESVQSYIPHSVDQLKMQAVGLLKVHSEKLSAAGVDTVKVLAHVLLGLVAGAMVAWNTFDAPEAYRPFSQALLTRLNRLVSAFEKVVFAQAQISLVNTTLTAVYLLVVLPACGVRLPLVKTLIALTFLAGMLPVVGNLISNSAIVLISLGTSMGAGLAALGFLIAIHKAEYFLNAKIIGHNVNAAAWELIISMLTLEALFGMPGLVVAPILYAYIKAELAAAGLVGKRPLPRPAQAAEVAVTAAQSTNG